jgi:hypothetical protein
MDEAEAFLTTAPERAGQAVKHTIKKKAKPTL